MPATPRYAFISQPGVRRDGTELDSPFYADGEWVRWQRGKPRKMWGYRSMSQLANGPVRTLYADSRNDTLSVHAFSQWGVQRLQFDTTGSGGGLEDRTPVDFVPDFRLTWSATSMFSSTGSAYSAIIAAATPDVTDTASTEEGAVYAGELNGSDPLVAVADGSGPILTSGGVCVLQPYLFVYGNNGLIRNSNANDFSASTGWTTGGANTANSANVSATKFVYGAPARGGGQSPAGLFWSLDSLVRVTFTSDARLWAYDTLTNPTSIMSKKCVVELDGKFFWVGTDRFFMYNGVVQELPNNMNQNWFFDNLNYLYRNKVWGTKVTRWGEIWWFYPRGNDTECNDAIIFNYRENTWYDAVKARTAGDAVQQFPNPIWAGGEDLQDTTLLRTGLKLALSALATQPTSTLVFTDTTGVVDGMLVSGPAGVVFGTLVVSHTGTDVTLDTPTTVDLAAGAFITFTSMLVPFVVGSAVTGGTSGAIGRAVRVTETYLNVVDVTGAFAAAETITGIGGATATVQAAPIAQQLDTLYQQEWGLDKIVGQDISAIRSSFVSSNFGLAVGDARNPFVSAPGTSDVMTQVGVLEPDFKASGALSLTLQGRSYAVNQPRDLETLVAAPTEPFVTFRGQERILRIKVESNVVGGDYQQGIVMLELEPGDQRPSTVT